MPNLERLLLAVDDSANGKFASRIAGLLAGTGGMPTTVLHIKTDEDRQAARPKAGKDDAQPAEKAEPKVQAKTTSRRNSPEKAERTEKIEAKKAKRPARPSRKRPRRSRASRRMKKRSTRRSTSPPSCTNRRSRDCDRGGSREGLRPDAHRTWRKTVRRGTRNSTRASRSSPRASRARWRSRTRAANCRASPDGKLSILVPVNGTEVSRRGAEVAITMARATQGAAHRALRRRARRQARGRRCLAQPRPRGSNPEGHRRASPTATT